MTPEPDSGPTTAATKPALGFWEKGLGLRLVEGLPFGRKLPQLVRYAAVSGIATIISTTVLSVLTFTRTMTPGWANIVAVSIGTVPSFELNRRWVWGHDERRLLAHAAPFTALSFLGLAISTFTVSVTGRWADHHHLSPLLRTISVDGANYIGFAILWIAQFVILDRLLFGRHGSGPDEPTGTTGADGTAPQAVHTRPPLLRTATPAVADGATPAATIVPGRVLDNA